MNQIETVARAMKSAILLYVAKDIYAHDLDEDELVAISEDAIAAMAPAPPPGARWQLGDHVRKKRGSSWRGVVCGFYSTPHTAQGYCVDSAFEPGSVQVWPEAALEDWDGVMAEDELRAEITRLTEALRAAEEREKGLREALEPFVAARLLIGGEIIGLERWHFDRASAALKDQPHD